LNPTIPAWVRFHNVGVVVGQSVGSTEGEEGILQAKLVPSAEVVPVGMEKIDKLVNLTAHC
jgi:hypothetical protein